MAQDMFSAQELIDFFSIEKELALKHIKKRGYTIYEPAISTPIISNESSLFLKNKDDSGVTLGFDGKRIWLLLHFNSLQNIHLILDDFKNSGWKLSKKKHDTYEVYENRQMDFSVAYFIDSENNAHWIQMENRLTKK